MSIYYEGVKVTKTMKLSSLNIVVGTKFKIVQCKIDIDEVPNIIADMHQEDPFTCEQGVAQMSCGHFMGKESMTILVRSFITENKYEIKCPHKD